MPQRLCLVIQSIQQVWRMVSLEEEPPVNSMCACCRILTWLSLPSLLFVLAVVLPSPLPGCSSWRAQTLLQQDLPLWTCGLRGNTNSSSSWQCPKPGLSSLSLHPFILAQENKVVKSRSLLYNINTLQLLCIHTNVKRLEPSYFPSNLDITQLWSRYAYPFPFVKLFDPR